MNDRKKMMGDMSVAMKKKKQMPKPMGMKSGGMAKYARGGGIERKGKTRGTMC